MKISRHDRKGTRDGCLCYRVVYEETMTEFYVKVKPGQEEFTIENGTIPKIRLVNEAENGRANAELVEKLGRILGERPGIISGHKSSRKKLKVDLPEEKIREKLER